MAGGMSTTRSATTSVYPGGLWTQPLSTPSYGPRHHLDAFSNLARLLIGTIHHVNERTTAATFPFVLDHMHSTQAIDLHDSFTIVRAETPVVEMGGVMATGMLDLSDSHQVAIAIAADHGAGPPWSRGHEIIVRVAWCPKIAALWSSCGATS